MSWGPALPVWRQSGADESESPTAGRVHSLRENRFQDRVSMGLCAVTRVVFDSLNAPSTAVHEED